MARPYWSGQVTISLVSFGVKLFVATEAKSQISFHQIDRSTGERVRHQKVLASAIERSPDEAADQSEVVEKSQIVKGYEYSKGHYVTIEPEELAHLRVPSKHTMEVTQFVNEDEIDPEFYEKPYFVVPENDAQTEAFLTVRKALQETKKVAITKIAFGGREHIVALAPGGPGGTDNKSETGGMMAYTLRYDAELRKPADYFSDIKHHSIDKESLDLAKELIKRRTAKFDPEKFVDGYEVAVKELVEAKLKHLPIPKDEEPAPAKGKVINLMDALRKSVSSGAKSSADEEAPAKRSPKKSAAAEKKTVSISSGTKKPPKSEKTARTTHKRKSA
ncbi:MAG TPA: Ku protein [Acidobacteriaceae bacterium]|nr:Ku protein [Acidobacteriaceae bacterium]